ncbi:MAG: hypothetical protein ACFBSG_18725 [Leptolyngbyaceae cyanobacterium]
MVSLKNALSGLLVGGLVMFGAIALADVAVAQTEIEPFDGAGTDDDGADLFGESSDPFELIHRAILAPSMSSDEFREQQNRAIGSEAQDFRLRQQEALRQQPTPTPEGAVDEVTVDGEEI